MARIAAFLPETSAIALSSKLWFHEFVFFGSWPEMAKAIRTGEFAGCVIDPAADGSVRTNQALSILRGAPFITAVAYVPLSAVSLHAVVTLSRHGVSHVFLHPLVEREVYRWKTIACDRTGSLDQDFLCVFDRQLRAMPGAITWVVQDLFRRPHRYGS